MPHIYINFNHKYLNKEMLHKPTDTPLCTKRNTLYPLQNNKDILSERA